MLRSINIVYPHQIRSTQLEYTPDKVLNYVPVLHCDLLFEQLESFLWSTMQIDQVFFVVYYATLSDSNYGPLFYSTSLFLLLNLLLYYIVLSGPVCCYTILLFVIKYGPLSGLYYDLLYDFIRPISVFEYTAPSDSHLYFLHRFTGSLFVAYYVALKTPSL